MYVALRPLKVSAPSGVRLVPVGGSVPEAVTWPLNVLRSHLNHDLLRFIPEEVALETPKIAAPLPAPTAVKVSIQTNTTKGKHKNQKRR